MSVFLMKKFRELIKEEDYPKKVEYHCDCCGAVFTATRRDLTYNLITFLLALRDLCNANKTTHYHYRDVIKYAKDKYGCVPSDYSILHRWKFIESKEGVNGDKYKALTVHGKQFLENKLYVYPMHYKIPQAADIVFISKNGKINFTDVELLRATKNVNTPFLFY